MTMVVATTIMVGVAMVVMVVVATLTKVMAVDNGGGDG